MKNQNSLIFRTTLKDFCPDNNHPHAIDMGEAGIWTCCNVGANSPEEYGGYYAWGETEEKSDYSDDTYKYYKAYLTYYGESHGYTKYCTEQSEGYGAGYYINGNKEKEYRNGFTDNKTELDLSDDVARQKWGGSWRIPSKEELEKLVANCTCEWTQINNVGGMMYTSTNGNRIFFPAAGFRNGTSLDGAGSFGDYWSRTLDADTPYGACYLRIGSGYLYYYYRSCGHAVRPLRPKN